jgi:hypothetical protein
VRIILKYGLTEWCEGEGIFEETQNMAQRWALVNTEENLYVFHRVVMYTEHSYIHRQNSFLSNIQIEIIYVKILKS